jgi:Carboxymuconolactone decarboxylase family
MAAPTAFDTHSNDARALGESEERLHLLAAWRWATCYDARERAALAWCEDLTLMSNQGASGPVYEQLEQTFSPGDIVALTLAIVAINGWNRLAISMRAPVGAYVSPHRHRLNRFAASPQVGLAGTHAKQKVNHAVAVREAEILWEGGRSLAEPGP